MPWWMSTAAIAIAFFIAAMSVGEWLAHRHRRRYFDLPAMDAIASERVADDDPR